ncbi:hypothetical protein LJX78_04620 [Methanimicrococcus blatticola]|uniref:hypothetical protein n=1 Tax=Methanimicrococcus blatticola TaxID=91560 RepID=UPI001CBF4899|nr:hypothetical protein [Methanimicrococcus blatticola]MBZ3935009.1 hypothetical protein [Methanimicrococcus blatticola]MCC2508893.1 hypothetical protein [Methanimicrococcus blatticola]
MEDKINESDLKTKKFTDPLNRHLINLNNRIADLSPSIEIKAIDEPTIGETIIMIFNMTQDEKNNYFVSVKLNEKVLDLSVYLYSSMENKTPYILEDLSKLINDVLLTLSDEKKQDDKKRDENYTRLTNLLKQKEKLK